MLNYSYFKTCTSFFHVTKITHHFTFCLYCAGIGHLNQLINKLSRGLQHLNLAKTGLSAKGVNRLADALATNKAIAATLTHLDLSDNSLRAEDITVRS